MNKGLLILIIVILFLVGLYFAGRLASRSLVEESGNKVTFKGEDGELSFEESGTLPEGFPSDFPIYPETKVVSSFSAKGEDTNGTSVVWESRDTVGSVSQFYKVELSNKEWKIVSSFEKEDSVTISFEKGTVSGFLGITKGEKGATTISVTIGTKEK